MNTPWMAQAACTGMEPDDFFPIRGGDSVGKARAAKAVCARCPVIDNCLDYAMRNKEPFGIFGGMTADERKDMRGRLGRRVA